MTVPRMVAAVMLTASFTAGCTSSGNGDTSGSPGPSGPSNSGGPSSSCTKSSAKKVKEALITSAGFSPSCVKIKAKAKFFFVNNEKKHHTATTMKGSPTSFDADLRTKGSTYQQIFKKPGKYVIFDKASKKSMTLYVG